MLLRYDPTKLTSSLIVVWPQCLSHQLWVTGKTEAESTLPHWQRTVQVRDAWLISAVKRGENFTKVLDDLTFQSQFRQSVWLWTCEQETQAKHLREWDLISDWNPGQLLIATEKNHLRVKNREFYYPNPVWSGMCFYACVQYWGDCFNAHSFRRLLKYWSGCRKQPQKLCKV